MARIFRSSACKPTSRLVTIRCGAMTKAMSSIASQTRNTPKRLRKSSTASRLSLRSADADALGGSGGSPPLRGTRALLPPTDTVTDRVTPIGADVRPNWDAHTLRARHQFSHSLPLVRARDQLGAFLALAPGGVEGERNAPADLQN